jgi:hypothetical protein
VRAKGRVNTACVEDFNPGIRQSTGESLRAFYRVPGSPQAVPGAGFSFAARSFRRTRAKSGRVTVGKAPLRRATRALNANLNREDDPGNKILVVDDRPLPAPSGSQSADGRFDVLTRRQDERSTFSNAVDLILLDVMIPSWMALPLASGSASIQRADHYSHRARREQDRVRGLIWGRTTIW